MSLTLWLSLLVICVLGAMSPGPSLAVVLRQTVSNGRGHGILAGCAHAVGVGLWAAMTVWGLGVLVNEYPLLYQLITWAGAAYLVWLGITALCMAATPALAAEQGQRESHWQAACSGALISLLNPKLAVFFTALFSQFVSPEQSMTDQLILVLTAALVDGVWYTLVALLFSRPALLAWLRLHLKRVEQLTGIVLIGLAIRVAIP
ncbi:MAG: LysE family transporter [Oceanospirillales bacterium]|uniref:Threonine/homoserine/homoserine lactone efflux protein n=1 Tax=Marinobacterium halophilum TaxID=267374 RepID=A0A2P8F211_9GAMM|nr:LysE family transporter [Marinobacterium halophilum]MBR9830454.1 LysE family transporter [Oceanospirillales bacterium]PSL15739.1 threonine/homoserine/homoserine lactone efflux protein [Marinobacterium halophilum]